MIVLGIDTATHVASVGLVADAQVLAEEASLTLTNHTETLLPLIRRLLNRTGLTLSDVHGFGVSIGPGSFTGLRIALGAVKGFAYALDQPVAAIPTLEALARTVPDWEGLVCPVLDARKGEVYTALFYRRHNGQLTRLCSDQVVTPAAFFTELKSPCLFIGDGIERYEELLHECCGPAIRLLPFSEYYPHGSVIALMAWERLSRGESDDIGSLIPSYVRKPEAEFKRVGQS